MRFSGRTFSMQRTFRFLPLVILPLVLLMACLVGSVPRAEAGVTLRGWRDINAGTPDGTADEAGKYEYVLFGDYPQLLGSSTVQPILWRVLSADRGSGVRRALLLSDKNLNIMAFDERQKSPPDSYGESRLEGGFWDNYNNNYAYSEIREFLVGYDNTGNFAPDGGIFANADYFSLLERGAVSADAFESKAGLGGGLRTGRRSIRCFCSRRSN